MKVGNKKRNQFGFTFIEVLLSTLLLGIGITGGLTLVQNSTLNSLENEYIVTASQLAHQKMETIISDKYYKGFSSIIPDNYPSETLASPYEDYRRTTVITEVDETDLATELPGSDFKRVDIEVAWGDQASQTLMLSSVFSNY